MMGGRARPSALGGGWSLVLTDLAAILLCFFTLAIALTPPARLEPTGAAGPVSAPWRSAPLALDTAIPASARPAEPDYVTALLRDRLSAGGVWTRVRQGVGVWLLRFDEPPPAAALGELLQAIEPLPVSLTVTLVTPDQEIQRQLAQRRSLAEELGPLADRVLVAHGSVRALELRLAVR